MHIYSPEFDKELLESLQYFKYPKEFDCLQPIIQALSKNLFYSDTYCTIELFNGDARVYIPTLKNIDIVYQDAFSSDVNHELWTVEYFSMIQAILNDDAIITTYSIATPIRLSLYFSGFTLYEYKPQNTNKITIALNAKEISLAYKYIDMELKQQRNRSAKALYD